MNINDITPRIVRSAYRGKPGCACGCNGDYVYTEQNRKIAGEWRGYTVDDNEIDEKKVSRILNKVKKHPDTVNYGSHLSLQTQSRLYIIHLVDEEDGA